MKLEKKDDSLLFSNTTLPDVFFTEYFPQASSDSIKVYLYFLFLSKNGKDIKINDFSKKIELPLKSIQDSIKYLETEGLLIRKPSGYEIANLQEMQLHKLYKSNVSLSPEEISKSSKNQRRAKAIESINNNFFQGMMSPAWYSDLDMWFSKYGFDEEVMIALFQYCFNRSALHRNYIQVVAEGWSKNNVKSYADLDKYYEKLDLLDDINKKISKKLGLSRSLTEYEKAYIEKWTIDYSYDMTIIEIALKKTTSKSNPNFDYLDKLLTDWHERNLKTVSDVNKFLEDIKQKGKDIKNFDKKSTYNNYNQRKYDNLSSLYINKNL